MRGTAPITVAAREIASAAAITAAAPESKGNFAWEQDEHKTYESNDKFFHDVSFSSFFYCFLGGLPFAVGSAPDEASGCGCANGMGFALAAFADANVSGGTAASSCQSESTKVWRNRSGSSRYVAWSNRGSLSSAPIHACINTPWSIYATMSVVVPPTTFDCPM